MQCNNRYQAAAYEMQRRIPKEEKANPLKTEHPEANILQVCTKN
jgi:hypothetical protein